MSNPVQSITTTYINNNELDLFAQVVKEKKYKKMDYLRWKAFVQLFSTCRDIGCTFHKEKNQITLRFGQDTSRYEFSANDGSFGEYIYQRYFKPIATLSRNRRIVIENGVATIFDDDEEYIKADEVPLTSDNFYTKFKYANSPNVTNVSSVTFDERNDTKMNNPIPYKFGRVANCDAIRMSAFGMAVKNANGVFVAYDKKNDALMDVDILNISGDGMFFQVPVAIKNIKAGDIVIHNHLPMFVDKVLDKSLKVIDPKNGERKEIMPAHNYFGFDFMTKVISLMDCFGGIAADADNPFGNLLPLMMFDNGVSGNKSNVVEAALMMSAMNGGKIDFSNPMMMMLLMGDTNGRDNLPMIFALSQMAQNQKDDD